MSKKDPTINEDTVVEVDVGKRQAFGISLNTLGVIAVFLVSGVVQWQSLKSLSESTAAAVKAQADALVAAQDQLSRAIVEGNKATEQHLSQRLDSVAELKKSDDRYSEAQRLALQVRLDATEKTLGAVQNLPSVVQDQSSRISKIESLLDSIQSMRIQLSTMELKITNIGEAQAATNRAVEKIASKP